MGNSEPRPNNPHENWTSFQLHIETLNELIDRNTNFLKTFLKIRELRMECRINYSGLMPEFICRKFFKSRTTVNVLYRYSEPHMSESGLEEPEFIQYNNAEQFLTLSANLLQIFEELVQFNQEMRQTFQLKSSQSQSNSLKKSQTFSEYDLYVCGICFERPMQAVMPCKHAYCEQCAQDWLKKSDECPMCRQQIKRDSYFIQETDLERLMVERRNFLFSEVELILRQLLQQQVP